jgi:hypothetical protein
MTTITTVKVTELRVKPLAASVTSTLMLCVPSRVQTVEPIVMSDAIGGEQVIQDGHSPDDTSTMFNVGVKVHPARSGS